MYSYFAVEYVLLYLFFILGKRSSYKNDEHYLCCIFSGGIKMTSAGIVNPLSIDPNERVTPSHHHMMPSTDHTGERNDLIIGFSSIV